MYLEPNNPSLSFANFLDAAIRDKAEIKPFPYTLEVCRCRYCSYCQNGKCALKRCCCMSERVKAKSCTFAELLRDCFVNFKDNVFQFRLRIACERASELKTCFLDEGHKGRFYEGVSYMRKKDPKRDFSAADRRYHCKGSCLIPSAAEGEPRRTMSQFNTEITG